MRITTFAPTPQLAEPATAIRSIGSELDACPTLPSAIRTCGMSKPPFLRQGPDLARVLAMTLTATMHICLFAAAFLPDARTVIDPPEPVHADVAADDSQRLTIFVALDDAPDIPPAPPPMPPDHSERAEVEHQRASKPSLSRAALTLPAAPPALPSVVAAPSERTMPPPAAPVDTATSTEFLAPPRAAASTLASTSAPESTFANRIDPEAARRDRDAYIQALMAALLQQRIYPAEARKERVQGVVHVRFSIDLDGRVLASTVQRSAGELLDAAALQVLQRAAPLPRIPASMGRQVLTITVPIEYSLTTH